MRKSLLVKLILLPLLSLYLITGLNSCCGGTKKPINGTAVDKPEASVFASEEQKKAKTPANGSMVSASLDRAGKEGKFLVAMFFEKNDELTGQMRKVCQEAKKKYGKDKALFIEVDVNKKSEESAVTNYQIDRARKPVTLVIAADGTVVRGFSEKLSAADIEKAFVPEKMVKLLRALQEQRPVLVCFANKGFSNYEKVTSEVGAAVRGINGVVLIMVDPRNAKDLPLLEPFKLKPDMSENTVMMINRGSLLGKLTGEINSKAITDAFSCGSGCSSGG
ncbi:MAG: hypothetical protein AB9903_36365 [Vulcanimicrobiota bacterium]